MEPGLHSRQQPAILLTGTLLTRQATGIPQSHPGAETCAGHEAGRSTQFSVPHVRTQLLNLHRCTSLSRVLRGGWRDGKTQTDADTEKRERPEDRETAEKDFEKPRLGTIQRECTTRGQRVPEKRERQMPRQRED